MLQCVPEEEEHEDWAILKYSIRKSAPRKHPCEYHGNKIKTVTASYWWLGLYIIYFKWYDTYHDTHEVIFDMKLIIHFFLVLDQKNLNMSTNFMGIWEFEWPKYSTFKQKIYCS